MSSDGIFLRTDGELVLLQESPYDSESLLQELLAEYPEIIAGRATNSEDARLLLIRREMGVPSSAEGPNTFSLDHLFVNAAGVPVLVEVKRSSDTRIRREVVGQMLDYAANGARYWPIDVLRQAAEENARSLGRSVEELIEELRPGQDPTEFWTTVETNLSAGRIRLLFVADALPAELVRIIEFLNEQMSPAEVLGVELRQYRAGRHTAYVPRMIGATAAASGVKAGSGGPAWTRQSFLDAAAGRCSRPEVAMIERLFRDVDERGCKFSWGRGTTPGVSGWYDVAGQPTAVWSLNANDERAHTRAYLYFYLADLVGRIGAARIEQAAGILETVPGLRAKIADARASAWRKYPSLYLADIAGTDRSVDAVFAAIRILSSTED
jgi:hypothetical protein